MVSDWLKDKGKQVFYLSGYAGTGKTTLAKEIASVVDGDVMFGAYTGKAAQVLQSKGCPNAQTIHSMIYHVDNPNAEIPRFSVNYGSTVKHADLVIIDECSMIDEKMGKDLLKFGTKILVLGDPAQLPPIGGEGFFTGKKPDFTLTEIHRQAADNPIIALSIDIREGKQLVPGVYGESRILFARGMPIEDYLKTDQLIVGLNTTRGFYNSTIRDMRKFEGEMPLPGEKIICLRNDYRVNIFNGTTWIVEDAKADENSSRLAILNVKDFETGEIKKRIAVYKEFFSGQEKFVTAEEKKETQQFTYGYAITCHKSQGSQWNDVTVYDQSRFFREDAKRWLYTAVTRAAEKVTVVIPG